VWRWCAVAASVALLGLVPLGLARLPATAELPERALMRKILSSDSIPYQGVAESSAGLGLPDVPRAGRLVDLFSETTRMRAWVAGPKRWRVDSLTPIGERDTYRDLGGTWIWDSSERTALRVEGEGAVRFARPADLLPPELGRRLIAAAQPEETSALPARRVAGIDAAGIRIAPRAPSTTLERVDVWADPGSGLPLRVEVTARTVPGPLLTTSFLELEQVPPPADRVKFTMPAGAEVHSTSAPDFARAVDHFSPFVLPDVLAGAHRRMEVGGAAATYGEGFSVVAVLALPERFSPDDELSALPARAGPWGHALTVTTPLLNGMLFASNEVAYVLGGSVEMTVLERFATQLARGELEVRG
jgi:outer membrane lipoprotein-sorting protein